MAQKIIHGYQKCVKKFPGAGVGREHALRSPKRRVVTHTCELFLEKDVLYSLPEKKTYSILCSASRFEFPASSKKVQSKMMADPAVNSKHLERATLQKLQQYNHLIGESPPKDM